MPRTATPRPARDVRRLAVAGALACLALASPTGAAETTPHDVLETYVDIAQAAYTDALHDARELGTAIAALLDEPSEDALDVAREAWREARLPYLQTEVLRANPLVGEWRDRVNPTALDAALLEPDERGRDVAGDARPAALVTDETVEIDGRRIDASDIDPALLIGIVREAGASVTGYSAIGLLLRGRPPDGGQSDVARPASDFDVDACTHGHCDRRARLLSATGRVLVDDLEQMVTHWVPGGMARDALVDAAADGAVRTMLEGMISLSVELADDPSAARRPEALGMRNVWEGRFDRPDGPAVEGPGLRELVAATDPQLAARLSIELAAGIEALEQAPPAAAKQAFDAQLRTIELVADALGQGGIRVDVEPDPDRDLDR